MLLSGVRWFETDVSGQHIRQIFKRMFLTTWHWLTTQKTELFMLEHFYFLKYTENVWMLVMLFVAQNDYMHLNDATLALAQEYKAMMTDRRWYDDNPSVWYWRWCGMSDSLPIVNSPENQSFVSKQLIKYYTYPNIQFYDSQLLNVLIPSLRITIGQIENSLSIVEISHV